MPGEKEKIEIKINTKKRIPVPKKPPKIIAGKKSYSRKKEKDKIAKKGLEEK